MAPWLGEVWRADTAILARSAAVSYRHNASRALRASSSCCIHARRSDARFRSRIRSAYDFGVNDTGNFYYVMELLEGLDLHSMVKRFGPQPAERVIMLLRQVCRSLAEAHEHGLVHRDIKPANLFVTCLGHEYDYVKVLDFGIVKAAADGRSVVLSPRGALRARTIRRGTGSPRANRRRADIYSLAAARTGPSRKLLFGASPRRESCITLTAPVPLNRSRSFPFRTVRDDIMSVLKKIRKRFRPASNSIAELARVTTGSPAQGEPGSGGDTCPESWQKSGPSSRVKIWLHSTGDASSLAALLLTQYCIAVVELAIERLARLGHADFQKGC